MFRGRGTWVWLAKRSKPIPARPHCTSANSNTTKPASNNRSNASDSNVGESSQGNYDEAYKQLDKLDFPTAAKILFTDPPKKEKFGVDFHLVQLFFACMPSLAVFLVAQYARYEIRRMEAELEQKKKIEEEEKAKEAELNATEEEEAGSVPELLEVKVRLDKLEEAIKGIVVESKQAKTIEDGSQRKDLMTTEPNRTKSSSETSKMTDRDSPEKQESVKPRPGLGQERVSGAATAPDARLQDQKGKIQNGGASQDVRT